MPLRYASTASLPATLTVTSSVTEVVPKNTSRLSLLILNTSSQSVYFGYSPTGLTIANGIRVLAGGAFAEDAYIGPVYALVGGGTANLPYLEVF